MEKVCKKGSILNFWAMKHIVNKKITLKRSQVFYEDMKTRRKITSWHLRQQKCSTKHRLKGTTLKCYLKRELYSALVIQGHIGKCIPECKHPRAQMPLQPWFSWTKVLLELVDFGVIHVVLVLQVCGMQELWYQRGLYSDIRRRPVRPGNFSPSRQYVNL